MRRNQPSIWTARATTRRHNRPPIVIVTIQRCCTAQVKRPVGMDGSKNRIQYLEMHPFASANLRAIDPVVSETNKRGHKPTELPWQVKKRNKSFESSGAVKEAGRLVTTSGRSTVDVLLHHPREKTAIGRPTPSSVGFLARH